MRSTTFFLLISAAPALADWQSRHQTCERRLAEGRTNEAISELEQALAEATADGRGVLLEALGRAEFLAGRYREAKRHLETSLTLWPADSRERAVVLSTLGQVHLDLREDARAEQVMGQALATLSAEPAVWHRLGQAQFRRGRQEAAEESFQKALSLATAAQRPSIASDLAAMLEARHRYAKAAEIWREAIAQASPGQARARMMANLGALQWKRSEKGRAAVQFQLALAEMEAAVGPRHPDVARILEEYQEILRKTGRKAEAMAAGERASAIRTSYAPHTRDRRASVDWRDLRR